MESLKREKRWCIWKREFSGERLTKIPYSDMSNKALSNKPETWIAFDTAKELLDNNPNEIAGCGFFLTPIDADAEFSLCGIDVDAHNSEGRENEYAEEILHHFSGTYAETSPSGNGYHILCYVNLSALKDTGFEEKNYLMRNSEKELEIYIGRYTHRYLTYTGNTVSATTEVTDQTANVIEFLELYMKRPVRNKPISAPHLVADDNIDIQKRLNLARRSRYGADFRRLYDQGDLSAYKNDHHVADMALVRRLCYWLNADPKLIDEAFRGSALYREEKWDDRRGDSTYGAITIQKVIDTCESIYLPPEIYRQEMQWRKELFSDADTVSDQSIVEDTTLEGKAISPSDVLEMINEIENDLSTRDRITVLPLMCGTGKSTAIRLKMRQVIEANDGTGMIVITDSIERMRDYLDPPDDEMKAFFLDYGHLITLMTHETLEENLRNEHRCPILIMSTQRYLGLSHKEIERYLKWDGGERSLIIVDEQPGFLKTVDVSFHEVRDFGTSIQSIPISEEEKSEYRITYRHLIELPLNLFFQNCRNTITQPGQYYFFHPKRGTISTSLESCFMLLEKNKHDLMRTLPKYIDNPYLKLSALKMIFTEGALFQVRKMKSGAVIDSFTVVVNRFSNFTDLDAKVIILDGTADISISYELFKDELDIRDCSQFERRLDKLHVEIVDMATGKSSLTISEQSKKEAVDKVRDYLEQTVPEGCKPVVFSYKDMRKAFSDYDDKHYDWFGSIKGKNDYRSEEWIAQVGLNRFPMGNYFMYELSSKQDLVSTLAQADPLYQNSLITARVEPHDGFTYKAMIRELLADTEQNLFRGIIRQSQSDKEYHFILFTSFKENASLISAIRERYERLGATVTLVERPQEDRVKKLMERNQSGKESVARRIVRWHDEVIDIGTQYTYEDIAKGIGVSKATIRDTCKISNNKVLNNLLTQERIQEERTATFIKKGNWVK